MIVDTFFCKSAELATCLGITKRAIRKLVDKNIIIKLDHGKYDKVKSIRNYIKYREQITADRLKRLNGRYS